MPEELYYTVADLQYRKWLISLCLGDKGHSLCCKSKTGNEIECGCIRQFKLAHAYLDILCNYTSLACVSYSTFFSKYKRNDTVPLDMGIYKSIYVEETNKTYSWAWDPAEDEYAMIALDESGILVERIDFPVSIYGSINSFAYNSKDGYLIAGTTGGGINQIGLRIQPIESGEWDIAQLTPSSLPTDGNLSAYMPKADVEAFGVYGFIIVGKYQTGSNPVNIRAYLSNEVGFPNTESVAYSINDGPGGAFKCCTAIANGQLAYCPTNNSIYIVDVTDGNDRMIRLDCDKVSTGPEVAGTINYVSTSIACNGVIYNPIADEIVGISGGDQANTDLAKLVRIDPATDTEIDTVYYPDNVFNDLPYRFGVVDTKCKRIITNVKTDIEPSGSVVNQDEFFVFDAQYYQFIERFYANNEDTGHVMDTYGMTYQSTSEDTYLNNGDYSTDPRYPDTETIYCVTSSDLGSVNCVSEKQLDLILAWFEDYCNLCFILKGNAPSLDDNASRIPYGTPCADLKLIDIITVSKLCGLGIEDAGLALLEDSDSEIDLEETTCLLAEDEAAWTAYMRRFNSLVFP